MNVGKGRVMPHPTELMPFHRFASTVRSMHRGEWKWCMLRIDIVNAVVMPSKRTCP